MVFVGAAIMPHGALPFDGNKDSESSECRERHRKLPTGFARKFTNLYEGMCEVGKSVAAMEPDIIILHSPHGIVLENSVGVYLNPTARGDAGWNDCWTEFKVDLLLDLEKSEALVKYLRAGDVPADGICCFSRFEAPLKWGEAIPAWYLQKYTRKDVRYIMVTQSRQPWPVDAVSDYRLRVGHRLRTFVDELEERVALVISGDLSHVYHSDYPDKLYQPAKGWTLQADHVAACAMERAFLGWVKSIKNIERFDGDDPLPPADAVWSPSQALPWLQKAAELQPTAYSCGMIGFILLHAFLQGQHDNGAKVNATVNACEAPTYYGMLAAVFSII